MALRDWIIDSEQIATATVATTATLGSPLYFEKKRSAVLANSEKIESNGQKGIRTSAYTPAICTACDQLEVVNIMGKDVPGCLYTAIGEYPDGWKRLPDGIEKCLFSAMRSPANSEGQWANPGIHWRENSKWPHLSQHDPSCQPLRKKQCRRPSPVALAWLLEHREELRQAGWTMPELYRRNKSKGIIWLSQWSNPNVDVSLMPGGGIVFLFTDRGIRQTAWPKQPTFQGLNSVRE